MSDATGCELRPSVLLMDASEHNLQLSAQCGVKSIVAPFPGTSEVLGFRVLVVGSFRCGGPVWVQLARLCWPLLV